MIIHDFGISLEVYKERGILNEFPIIMKCESCHARGLLHRHGYYWRYAITDDESSLIPICRLKCTHCQKTFSVIPDFLIPYFQHTLHTIMNRLEDVLLRKKANESRQLLAFYLKRFMKNCNWIHSFFSDLGELLIFSSDKKEKATKYMKMIRDFGESTFLRRSKGHLSSYFMAN